MRGTPAPAFVLFGVLVAFAAADRGAFAVDAGAASSPASRIVSIGGSVTEILYALGQQDKIVAVDATSLYPASALKDKPNVGYMRNLSAEGVLGLSPTLILAIEGSGPKETIDVLKEAKVPLVVVPDKFSADGVVDKIRMIAKEVGVPQRGECLVGMVQQDTSALDAARKDIQRSIKIAFVLSLAGGRPLMAGHGTAADGIIGMAGAANAFDDFEGYKPVNDEAIVAAKPDAVLVMDRGAQALTAENVFSEPGLAMTPAAAHKTLVSMDGLYLLGFGPRTMRAARDLAKDLYPNIPSVALPSEHQGDPARCSQ